jgi:hypothetical protein
MKRIALFLGCCFILALSFSSCRTQKKACAAYSHAEPAQVDKEIES